jgi:ubiquinone/menaquinone biosynthesis C-methylase UbiE
MNSNYSIRDEIRDFWSERAATFDESVGHEIFSEEERKGWQRLIRKHLGDGTGRAALDLACGTAVISHLMNDVGFKVTGLDWSDAMLGQAPISASCPAMLKTQWSRRTVTTSSPIGIWYGRWSIRRPPLRNGSPS